jgi:hypothetical protein
MINFGPATIYHEGEDLGKTLGGGSLTFHEVTYRGLRSKEQSRIVTGGEGIINLVDLTDEVEIIGDHLFLDYGELIIECSDVTITLPSCKIDFVADIQFGTLNQFTWQLRLTFKKSSGANTYVYSVE